MERTDAEKGKLALDAFRTAGAAPGGSLGERELVADF